MEKIKSYIPGVGFIVKVILVVVIVNAAKELFGGKVAAVVERPIAGIKSLVGMA